MKPFVHLVFPGFRSLRSVALAAVLTMLFGNLSVDAIADTGFSQSKDISTAEAANKLLQPTSPTGDTGLTSELASPSSSPTSDTPVLRGEQLETLMAIAVKKLAVINCTNQKIRVRTYNTADIVYAIPYQDKTLQAGDHSELDCASSKCRVQISNGKPSSPIAGGYRYDGRLSSLGNTVSCN